MKWKKLQHNGILFPPEYEKQGITIKVKGETINLDINQEEMVYQWAKKKDTPYAQDKVFQKNFTGDFAKTLDSKFKKISYEDIDFSNPDFDKWPALKQAKGYYTELKHGEVLYMPEGFWHHMKYITPGFSMSLRALTKNPKNLIKAVYNIAAMRHFDNLMRKIKGQGWIDWKNQKAIARTHKKFD